MDERTYHHGSLRTVLLDAARVALRDGGLDRLSLRELARQAGVSHGAPRHHFPDRQALLDALAVAGFDRLAEELSAALAQAGDDPIERVRAVAHAHLRFATDDAVLLELMFATKVADGGSDELRVAGERMWAILVDVVVEAQRARLLVDGDPTRLCLLLGATLQGLATFRGSGRLDADTTGALVEDAVALLRRQPDPPATGGRSERA